MEVDFFEMFMLQVEGVVAHWALGIIGVIGLGIGGDHILSSAGISGDGMDCDWMIARHDVRRDQRPEQRERADCIASWVGDVFCCSDSLWLSFVPFWHAIGPVFFGAVSGACVEQFEARRCGHADGFARGVIGQAEHGEVGAVEGVLARAGIFALFVGEQNEFDAGLFGESFVDLQSGCADMTVYEDAFFHWSVSRNSRTAALKVSGLSSLAKCPALGMTIFSALGIFFSI